MNYEKNRYRNDQIIHSDDPKALEKLTARIEAQEALSAKMVAANKIFRASMPEIDKVHKIVAMGFREDDVRRRLVPSFGGHVGFWRSDLAGVRQEITRLTGRLAQVKRLQERKPIDSFEGHGYRYFEAEDRHQFKFAQKPPVVVTRAFRSHGFLWSPRRSTWVRRISPQSAFSLQSLRSHLDRLLQALVDSGQWTVNS